MREGDFDDEDVVDRFRFTNLTSNETDDFRDSHSQKGGHDMFVLGDGVVGEGRRLRVTYKGGGCRVL